MLFAAFRFPPPLRFVKDVETSYVESMIGIWAFPRSCTAGCGLWGVGCEVRGDGQSQRTGSESVSFARNATFIYRVVNWVSRKYRRPIALLMLLLELCFCTCRTTIRDVSNGCSQTQNACQRRTQSLFWLLSALHCSKQHVPFNANSQTTSRDSAAQWSWKTYNTESCYRWQIVTFIKAGLLSPRPYDIGLD